MNKEIIRTGRHKITGKSVALVKLEFDNNTCEYVTQAMDSNECFTNPNSNQGIATSNFLSVAYSDEYYEKIKNIPKQDIRHINRVVDEWSYGGVPMQILITNNIGK